MQAAPGERYLHEIAQHALGVLQIVSLVPYTRRLVVGSTLSNDRSGMAVFLDSASGAAFCDPEVSVSSPVSFFYEFLLLFLYGDIKPSLWVGFSFLIHLGSCMYPYGIWIG